MSGFSSFIASFCSVCILLGVLCMLCPEGAMSNPVKYVFSICFLCCVLTTSVGLADIDFSQDFEQTPQYVTEDMSRQTAEMVFKSALQAENIEFTKLSVITDKLDDGSIIINKVIIYTSAAKEEIARAIDPKDFEVCVINE